MSDVILSELKEIIHKKFSIELQNIQIEKDIFDTLNVNSVDVLSLLTDLEDHFDIEIPDYELQDVKTFGQLVDVIALRK